MSVATWDISGIGIIRNKNMVCSVRLGALVEFPQRTPSNLAGAD